MIEYEVIVQGSSHRVRETRAEELDAEQQALLFCQTLLKVGFCHGTEWWPPHEIARVQWTVRIPNPNIREYTTVEGVT